MFIEKEILISIYYLNHEGAIIAQGPETTTIKTIIRVATQVAKVIILIKQPTPP